ncbi:hypothetical protein HYV49_03125 [Candidatus Pacearchaeota archaeon]|nr:hypothetical protein [Candidatus Pacearchaeota archaeon]
MRQRKRKERLKKENSDNKSKNYFDLKTEKNIIKFQKEKKIEKRKIIFDNLIRPSFEKLIENIIFVYKFKSLESIDVLKNDCLSYLFEKLYMFDAKKGHRAFSYFNVIAKNWFLQEVKLNNKKIKYEIPISKELLENPENANNFIIQSFENDITNYEFLENLKTEMKSWLLKVKNEQEQKVLNAIIMLFENPDLQLFNKKAIYLYLREIVGMNGKQIASSLIKLKKRYIVFKKKFFNEII